jgi:hypothetical protein
MVLEVSTDIGFCMLFKGLGPMEEARPLLVLQGNRGITTAVNHPYSIPVCFRIVTQTIKDERTDGRTMAAGSSVTWTHCSVRYEVTWDKTLASAWTRACPRGRAASTPWMPRNYIRGPQTFHSHFLHRLGLEKLQCVWCTSWSGLR